MEETTENPAPSPAPGPETRQQFEARVKEDLEGVVDPGAPPEPEPDEAPEAKPAAEPPPTKAGEAEEPAIPPSLLERARDHGLTEDDVKELGDAGKLEKILTSLDRAAVRERRQPEQKPEPKAEEQKPEPKQKPRSLRERNEEFKAKGEYAYDDGLVERDEWVSSQIEELRGVIEEVAPMLQELHDERVRKHHDDLDSTFAELADDLAPAVGKQKYGELKADSAEMKARLAIIDAAKALQGSYKRQGRPMPPDKELLKRAAAALYHEEAGKRAAEKATKDVADKLRNRAGQFVSKPSGRRGVPASNESEAAKLLEAGLRELGHLNGATEGDSLDGVPD